MRDKYAQIKFSLQKPKAKKCMNTFKKNVHYHLLFHEMYRKYFKYFVCHSFYFKLITCHTRFKAFLKDYSISIEDRLHN